jgi:hypothetical protein
VAQKREGGKMLGWFKKRGAPATGPDYRNVDSREKAEDLHRKGELQELFLLPPEFGGERIPPNVVYVPPFAVELKARLDLGTISQLARDGHVTRYTATPTYEGRSVVPTQIHISATEPGNFTGTISIWGEAVQNEREPVLKPEALPVSEFRIEASMIERLGPSELVRAFIADYEAWNLYCNQLCSRDRETGMQAAEAAYASLLEKYCPAGQTRQPIAFGSHSSHESASEVILEMVESKDTCLVKTRHSKGTGTLAMEDDYEYHLKQQDGRWYLTSVLYVCDDGKYEGL